MKQLLVVLSLFMWIGGKQQTDKPQENGQDSVYSSAEQMPQPGFNIIEFLAQNLIYRDSIDRTEIQGRLLVSLIVYEDGHTGDYKILNKRNTQLEKSVIEVLRKMPKWQAGKQNGKYVKAYYTMPIFLEPE